MNRQLWLWDIECYVNYFCITFQDTQSGQKHYFEVSSRIDQSEELRTFVSFLSGYLVSFNGQDYDDIILSYWYQENPDLLSLKVFSDAVINRQEDSYKYYKWLRCFPSLKSIDLFRYWSKMLRLSKKISLKSLGIQLGYHTVQELPYHHTTVLTESQMEEVKYYNYEHDLNILKLLYEALKDQVELRFSVEEQYKIKCISDDAPRIALKLIGKDIEQYIPDYKDLRTYRSEIKLADILLNYDFTQSQMLYKIDKKVVVCSNYYTLYNLLKQQTIKSTSELSYAVILANPNGLYLRNDHGTGGIHGITSQKVWKESETHIIKDWDVASLYPKTIVNNDFTPQHLRPYFKDLFNSLIERRLKAKREKDKLTDSVLKLCINSSYGVMGSEYTFLYDLQQVVATTLAGQLLMGYVCEKLIENNFTVIATNTDSVTIHCEKNRTEECANIINTIGSQFGYEFEEETFTELYFQHINSYIAKTTEGKIKQKGVFVYKKPLGDSVDELIIPKTLEAYFIRKQRPEDFIKAHTDIKDFCLSKKISKDYSVFWNGAKVQNLNRFYVSKKGAYLYKKKSRNLEHVLKGYAVQLYNNLRPEFPDDVNYDYYVKKTWEIIWEIEGTNLTLF